jgi:hypothetical protein
MKNKPIKINKALTLVYFNNLILGELRRQGINCWIAGGALRDYFTDKPLTTDCDIYFPNATEFNKAKNYFLSKGGQIIYESENGMKVTDGGKTFDLVKIFRPNPIETINQFDFTISMFATDGKDIFYGDNSIKDLQDRKLVLNNLIMPISTLRRVLKHYKKGYTMFPEDQKKLYDLMKKLPYDDTDDLLNASGRGTSGDGVRTNTVFVSKDLPEEKPDYLKYAMIGVLALLVGYVAYKKFNKPQ